MRVGTCTTLIVTCTAHVFSAFENYVRSGMAEPVAENSGRGKSAMELFRAVRLQTHDTFVVDRNRERFLLTFYPGGWLKRVKMIPVMILRSTKV